MKKIYVGAGYNSICMGPGRPEFKTGNAPGFEDYGNEVANGVCRQLSHPEFDEGYIANFMAARFLRQGNLAGFLPNWLPSLSGKPCMRVEGACGSGGLALAAAVRSVLSGMADSVFVVGIEIQNTVKAVYCADILAGAAHYAKQRKDGHAYFFPGIFSDRAGAYGSEYGQGITRKGMACWYENAVTNARHCRKAQEYSNTFEDLFERGMTAPNEKQFLEHLNYYDCSKISDGASGVGVFTEAGLDNVGLDKSQCVELVSVCSGGEDITKDPEDLTQLSNTKRVALQAMERAEVSVDGLAFAEVHDCFTIGGIMALEAIGIAKSGSGARWVCDGNGRVDGGKLPINPSGGLCGFGHATGASGVRQMVDIVGQFSGQADNPVDGGKDHALMVSMGGNDKTVTAIVARRCV